MPPVNPPERVYVTQPDLPPLEEFIPYLRQIWDSKQLTNNGPFHERLEAALCEYLGVEHLSLFANATLALVTALQTLRISGEVITTPYSFVATAHSLLWNNIKPVFVDVEAGSMNLDPEKIAAAITPQTSAILAVHCYGRPCDVGAIQRIADIYGLRVLYDGAHGFGVRHRGGGLLRYGDLSIVSFHATKVFTTFEGGAIISPDAKTKQRIDYLKNFGFADDVTVVAPGINAKMNEFQAALGLLQLPRIEGAIERRRLIAERYRTLLAALPGIGLPADLPDTRPNHSYFPILVEPSFPLDRDALHARLRAAGVMTRRYFYPLISDMPMYRGLPSAAGERLPVARGIAQKILCLPIYPALPLEKVDEIAGMVGAAARTAP